MGMHMHGGRFDEDDINIKNVELKHIKRTKEFFWPYRWHLAVAMCFVVATALLGLRGP